MQGGRDMLEMDRRKGMRQDEHRMSRGFSTMPLRMESSGCSRTVASSGMDSWEKREQVRNKNRAT